MVQKEVTLRRARRVTPNVNQGSRLPTIPVDNHPAAKLNIRNNGASLDHRIGDTRAAAQDAAKTGIVSVSKVGGSGGDIAPTNPELAGMHIVEWGKREDSRGGGRGPKETGDQKRLLDIPTSGGTGDIENEVSKTNVQDVTP